MHGTNMYVAVQTYPRRMVAGLEARLLSVTPWPRPHHDGEGTRT